MALYFFELSVLLFINDSIKSVMERKKKTLIIFISFIYLSLQIVHLPSSSVTTDVYILTTSVMKYSTVKIKKMNKIAVRPKLYLAAVWPSKSLLMQITLEIPFP